MRVIYRARQSAAWPPQRRFRRCRRRPAYCRGGIQSAGGHAHDARPVQGNRARNHRSDRRPFRSGFLDAAVLPQILSGRLKALGVSARRATSHCPKCRRSRNRDCWASYRSRGMRCSRRRIRHATSLCVSMRRRCVRSRNGHEIETADAGADLNVRARPNNSPQYPEPITSASRKLVKGDGDPAELIIFQRKRYWRPRMGLATTGREWASGIMTMASFARPFEDYSPRAAFDPAAIHRAIPAAGGFLAIGCEVHETMGAPAFR